MIILGEVVSPSNNAGKILIMPLASCAAILVRKNNTAEIMALHSPTESQTVTNLCFTDKETPHGVLHAVERIRVRGKNKNE